MAYINDTKTQVARHKIYLQNSVVCLQSDWWMALSFVKTVYKAITGLLFDTKPSSNYQCADPFVKLKLKKSDLYTYVVEEN